MRQPSALPRGNSEVHRTQIEPGAHASHHINEALLIGPSFPVSLSGPHFFLGSPPKHLLRQNPRLRC